MKIYITDNNPFRGKDSDFIIKRLCTIVNNTHIEGLQIVRNPYSKPFFQDDTHALNFCRYKYFSISHSNDVWAICFSEYECGLDIQFEKNCNRDRIASRFFKLEDCEYIDANPHRFFQYWTIYESLAKYKKMSIYKFFELLSQVTLQKIDSKEVIDSNNMDSLLFHHCDIHHFEDCMIYTYSSLYKIDNHSECNLYISVSLNDMEVFVNEFNYKSLQIMTPNIKWFSLDDILCKEEC